uniref:AAA+ ATPase domain-containing protein n=1 Tax=Plectus sambesii TaxID=2011161 RepID=A0A914VJT6_9BILA
METETAAEMLGRLRSIEAERVKLTVLPDIQPGRLLELLGEPGSGKSQLLMTTVVECVSQHANHRVLLIDLDGKLSVLRLVGMVEASVSTSSPVDCSSDQSTTAFDQAVASALKRITVITPRGAEDALKILDRIDELYWDRSDEKESRLALLCIDGIDALLDVDDQQDIDQLVSRIAQCAREYHIPAIVSRRLFRRYEEDTESTGNGDEANRRSETIAVGYLGKTWTYVVNCSIRLQPLTMEGEDDLCLVRAIVTNTATEEKNQMMLSISENGVQLYQSSE